MYASTILQWAAENRAREDARAEQEAARLAAANANRIAVCTLMGWSFVAWQAANLRKAA